MTKKCRVQMYDPAVKEPPYTFIVIDAFECEQPENDYLGQEFWKVLDYKCRELGEMFKFYTMSSDSNYDYDVVVYGRNI